MELSEQRKLVALWRRYLGGDLPTSITLREFYLDEVVPSDLYEYGCVFEVFDVIANGAFDLDESVTWRAWVTAHANAAA